MKPELRDHLIGKKHFRSVQIPADAINKDSRTIRMSFASETPVVRWWGIEVLRCTPDAVRRGRMDMGMPYLADHNPRDQRGRIEPCTLDSDRCIRGDVKFSRSAAGEDLWQDHLDGIRKETSIGYEIHQMQEMKPEAMSEGIKEIALREGVPVYDIFDWEPIEGSSVSMPADTSVGAGRNLEFYDREKPDEIKELLKKINERTDSPNQERQHSMEPTTVAPAAAAPAAPALSQAQLDQMEGERKAQIISIGERFKDRIKGNIKMEDIVKDALELKITTETFRDHVYRSVNDTKSLEHPDTELDLSERDKKKYSLRKMILTQLPGNEEKAGFERECSKTIQEKLGRAAKGLYVPHDIQVANQVIPIGFQREIDRMAQAYGIKTTFKRDLTVGSATAGGNLVATNLIAGSFIELLRHRLVAQKYGAQFMPGLVGNVAFPKQTGASTFYWVAENNNLTESAPTFGQVTLSPKSGGGYVDFARQLLLQSTPAVDMLVLADLTKVVALGVDKAVFHGAGASNEPKGIANVTSIGSEDGADFGFATAVLLETDVAKADADVDTMAYVMNATTRGALKTRPIAASGYPVFVVQNNEMNGYPVLMSNQISDGYIFFGDGSQVLVGEWGVLDVLVDPFTGGIAGTVRTIAFISVDVAVRQAVSQAITPSFT
jgi:HK97 family phage major capsid protein